MKFLNNIPKWKKFPDTQTLGYYHPMGNYIYLAEYKDENDFKTSLLNPAVDKNKFSVYIPMVRKQFRPQFYQNSIFR